MSKPATYITELGTPYIRLDDIPAKVRPEFDEWFQGQTGIMLDDGSLGVYPWDWDNFCAHMAGRPEFWD
jgi:hypothetical protein